MKTMIVDQSGPYFYSQNAATDFQEDHLEEYDPAILRKMERTFDKSAELDYWVLVGIVR